MVKLTKPMGGVYTYTYDVLGRKISEKAPNGGISTYTYDDSDRVISQAVPMGSNSQKSETRYTYDNNNNVLSESIKTNLVGTSSNTYRTTSYTYDKRNNLIRVQNVDKNNQVCYTEYEYDGVGNMTKMKAANGENVTAYTYDSQNRVTKMTDPMGMSETYSYDNSELLTTSKVRLNKKRSTIIGYSFRLKSGNMVQKIIQSF